MKFRAKTSDISSMQHFAKVVTTLTKLTKSCVLRITSDKLYFILAERVVNGGVSMWCELNRSHIFEEWCMEGIDVESANEIFMEFLPDSVHRAIKNTVPNAKSLKIKLTKKHGPCLTVEIELPSLSTHSRYSVNDIPVNIIPRRVWNDYQEPDMPDFDASIYMPPMKSIRNVAERMKNLSSFLIIAANSNGELTLRVETDMVTVSTYYRELDHPIWDDVEEAASGVRGRGKDPKEMMCARVDIKRLCQFLTGLSASPPAKVICNIIGNKVVHFYLLEDDISLQYFIPATAV